MRSQPNRLARFDVLIFPGGRAHKQADALGENARRAVKDFIRSGGGYVGICAGGFLASAQYDWSLGLVNTRTLTGDQEMPGVGIRSMADRGPGTVQIELTAEGQSIFGDRSAPIDISFSGGPIFLGPKRDDLPPHDPAGALHHRGFQLHPSARDHDRNPCDLRSQVRRRPCRCDQPPSRKHKGRRIPGKTRRPGDRTNASDRITPHPRQ